MAERQLYTLDVTGSSPVPPTILRSALRLSFVWQASDRLSQEPVALHRSARIASRCGSVHGPKRDGVPRVQEKMASAFAQGTTRSSADASFACRNGRQPMYIARLEFDRKRIRERPATAAETEANR